MRIENIQSSNQMLNLLKHWSWKIGIGSGHLWGTIKKYFEHIFVKIMWFHSRKILIYY